MSIELDESVKDRRINKPQHVQQLLAEQANILRKLVPKDNKEVMDIARTLAYIQSTTLMAMRDGEALEKLEKVEKMLEQLVDEVD